MIDRENFLYLLEKHIKNSCSKAEQAELERCFEAYSQQLFETERIEETKQRIYRRIKAGITTSRQHQVHRRVGIRAAALVAVFCIIAVLTQLWQPGPQPKLITVVSNLGEKKQLYLPDSTLVTLNAGSRITYPEFFNNKKRNVSMEGEAFFKVTHNPEKPFVVTSGNLKTRVLGTSFNIMSYTDSPVIKISLATGSVRVSKGDTIMATLKPDEQFCYDKKTGTYQKESQYTANDIAWVDNIIKLNDRSLEETIRIVERWFNVKLHVEDPKAFTQKITGKFTDPSLEETIQSLELLTRSKITCKKRVPSLKATK